MKRNGNQGLGSDLELSVEQFALLRVSGDVVLDERLLARENHRDETRVQRLLELADNLRRAGAGVESRLEKLSGRVNEPNRSFVRTSFLESLLDDLLEQWVNQLEKL